MLWMTNIVDVNKNVMFLMRKYFLNKNSFKGEEKSFQDISNSEQIINPF